MSIFRKKPGTKNLPPQDPVSFAVWQEIREAAFAVRCADKAGDSQAFDSWRRMEQLLHLSPASGAENLTTRVPKAWSYLDFTACVNAIEAITIALTAFQVPNREELISRMNSALAPYAKLTKTERALERLSGEASERSRR